MIGDLHGTPDYRAHLVGVVTARAVARVLTGPPGRPPPPRAPHSRLFS